MTTTMYSPSPSPTPAPPTLSGGGRTAIRVGLVIAAVLLLLGTVSSLTAVGVTLGNIRVVTDSKALPTSVRKLTIDTGRMPVAVRIVADENRREPRADLRFVSTASGAHQLDVSADATDARIVISGEAPEWLEWARAGEITVRVPPQFARRLALTVNQPFGILAVNADVDSLVAHTDNGAVMLRGAARVMELRTQHGQIATREPISVRESFSANSIQGGIDVEFGDVVPRNIEAVTNDGDVSVGLPAPGPYFIAAQAGYQGGTSIEVDQTQNAAQAVAAVTARSSTGSVSIDQRR